ncbi:MAG: ABC transporter ATP-binding protein [Nitrospirae bacterium]|nr:ABC transporter ATP-binding protein [Nitrospirota bacterium]
MAQILPQPILLTEEIKVSFTSNSKTLKAVDGVSFKVFEEDVLGLVGESGCGKTLTALSIMRLLPANASLSGKILYKGEDLLRKPESELRNIRGSEISMVFQEPMTSLNPVFTVGYQIAEVLTTHKKMNKKYAMKEAVELLRAVRIPSPEIRIKEYPHQLSGGMRQRVMIAMAIACRPSLIIADEPTTALDVTIQAQILELLDSLRRENKMSVLLITHDLGIVAECVKRVEIMYAGRIVEEADVRDIFTNPRHPYTIGLLESLPKKKGQRLTPIPGQVPRLSELHQGCKFSTRCRYSINECNSKEPELIPIDNTNHRSRCIKAGEL